MVAAAGPTAQDLVYVSRANRGQGLYLGHRRVIGTQRGAEVVDPGFDTTGSHVVSLVVFGQVFLTL